jgi:hypothetical protein
MRAREFIHENKNQSISSNGILPAEESDPMRYTYSIPGLTASDPYKIYRFGVAMARARADQGDKLNPQNKEIDPFKPTWSAETVFGEHGLVVGMNSSVEGVIDQALAMTKTPGGKKLVSTVKSEEPNFVATQSPVKAFKGYPR